jgi:hypothetical protein
LIVTKVTKAIGLLKRYTLQLQGYFVVGSEPHKNDATLLLKNKNKNKK